MVRYHVMNVANVSNVVEAEPRDWIPLVLILIVVASKATAGGPYDSPGKEDCCYKHPNLVDSDEVKQNVACMSRNNNELLRNNFCKQNSNCDTVLLEVTDV